MAITVGPLTIPTSGTDPKVAAKGTAEDAVEALVQGVVDQLGTAAEADEVNLRDRSTHTGTQTLDTITETAGLKVMTAAERTKLAGVETGATADQSGAEIKAAYEGQANTNAYTNAEKTKLEGVETGATANATDAALRDRSTHTGTQAAFTITGLAAVATSGNANDIVEGSINKLFTQPERNKLAAIEPDATANATDAALRARSSHTGTQSLDTITETTTKKIMTADERDKLASLEGSKFVGTYLNAAALAAAHPSPVIGSYGYVDDGAQSTLLFIWDADDAEWVDAGASGSSETSATIKSKYEANANTNAYTDADKTKLDGIATGATANDTDEYLLERGNHTGTQAIDTIAGLQEALDGIEPKYIFDTLASAVSKRSKMSNGDVFTVREAVPGTREPRRFRFETARSQADHNGVTIYGVGATFPTAYGETEWENFLGYGSTAVGIGCFVCVDPVITVASAGARVLTFNGSAGAIVIATTTRNIVQALVDAVADLNTDENGNQQKIARLDGQGKRYRCYGQIVLPDHFDGCKLNFANCEIRSGGVEDAFIITTDPDVASIVDLEDVLFGHESWADTEAAGESGSGIILAGKFKKSTHDGVVVNGFGGDPDGTSFGQAMVIWLEDMKAARGYSCVGSPAVGGTGQLRLAGLYRTTVYIGYMEGGDDSVQFVPLENNDGPMANGGYVDGKMICASVKSTLGRGVVNFLGQTCGAASSVIRSEIIGVTGFSNKRSVVVANETGLQYPVKGRTSEATSNGKFGVQISARGRTMFHERGNGVASDIISYQTPVGFVDGGISGLYTVTGRGNVTVVDTVAITSANNRITFENVNPITAGFANNDYISLSAPGTQAQNGQDPRAGIDKVFRVTEVASTYITLGDAGTRDAVLLDEGVFSATVTNMHTIITDNPEGLTGFVPSGVGATIYRSNRATIDLKIQANIEDLGLGNPALAQSAYCYGGPTSPVDRLDLDLVIATANGSGIEFRDCPDVVLRGAVTRAQSGFSGVVVGAGSSVRTIGFSANAEGASECVEVKNGGVLRDSMGLYKGVGDTEYAVRVRGGSQFHGVGTAIKNDSDDADLGRGVLFVDGSTGSLIGMDFQDLGTRPLAQQINAVNTTNKPRVSNCIGLNNPTGNIPIGAAPFDVPLSSVAVKADFSGGSDVVVEVDGVEVDHTATLWLDPWSLVSVVSYTTAPTLNYFSLS